jgi:hypothetical protein
MKSQVSAEWIILLSIVLVIVIVAVSSLSGIGSIGTNYRIRQEQRFWENADVGINSVSFNSSNGRISLINNLAYPMMVVNVSINDFVENNSIIIYPGQSGLINSTYALNLSFGEPYVLRFGFEFVNLIDNMTGIFQSDVPWRGRIAELN